MNKEEPYRSQAERLRKRIEKLNERTTEESGKLPPREQIHREKRKKTKIKLKYPVIRILVLFFILLPIVIFSVYSYLEGAKIKGPEKVSGDTSGYEVINFEKQQPESDDMPVEEEQAEIDNPVEGNDAVEVSQPITSAPEPAVNNANGGTDKNSGGQSEAPADTTKIVYHTVKPGENLYRIALKYYHSKAGEDIIRKENNINGNEIYLGQVLKIPLDK